MKGNGYYGEHLLHQAIEDPDVNALKRKEVETYIAEEAAKLCLDVEAVTDAAMRGYDSITTRDFSSATKISTQPAFQNS